MNYNTGEESVAAATRALLELRPFLTDLMAMDAVNYRGLARAIRPQVLDRTDRDSVNLDAIVMAIRRYESEADDVRGTTDLIERVLRESELTLKSDIVYYTFPRRPKFHRIAVETYREVDERSGDRVYILQSDAEIAVIVNEGNAGIVDEKFEEHEARNIERDLAMVVLDSPEEVLEADGILSYLTERIIWDGIGLIDMVTTYTECVFLVREADSTALYDTLNRLTADQS
ncbi:MAG: hypothetical protein ABEK12_02220 [Candidatus Nanohaloarchaea archaeon]